MSIKIDPEGPRRSKKDPVRVRKLRQTRQAGFDSYDVINVRVSKY